MVKCLLTHQIIFQFDAIPFLGQGLSMNPRSHALAHGDNVASQAVVGICYEVLCTEFNYHEFSYEANANVGCLVKGKVNFPCRGVYSFAL
jgi:hypothetical protein